MTSPWHRLGAPEGESFFPVSEHFQIFFEFFALVFESAKPLKEAFFHAEFFRRTGFGPAQAPQSFNMHIVDFPTTLNSPGRVPMLKLGIVTRPGIVRISATISIRKASSISRNSLGGDSQCPTVYTPGILVPSLQ